MEARLNILIQTHSMHFQQLNPSAICRRLASKGLPATESGILQSKGKTLETLGDWTSFPKTFPFVWVRGESGEKFFARVGEERKVAQLFIHSDFSASINTILLQHEKVFFKYLNYVLKLSVFVFIFSRETFLSIFFPRGCIFSFNVFKALRRFPFSSEVSPTFASRFSNAERTAECRWTKWTNGLVTFRENGADGYFFQLPWRLIELNFDIL